MINHANLPITIPKGVWTEAAATANSINRVLITRSKLVASYKTLYKKEAQFV
jgi:hypothetical protein